MESIFITSLNKFDRKNKLDNKNDGSFFTFVKDSHRLTPGFCYGISSAWQKALLFYHSKLTLRNLIAHGLSKCVLLFSFLCFPVLVTVVVLICLLMLMNVCA